MSYGLTGDAGSDCDGCEGLMNGRGPPCIPGDTMLSLRMSPALGDLMAGLGDAILIGDGWDMSGGKDGAMVVVIVFFTLGGFSHNALGSRFSVSVVDG